MGCELMRFKPTDIYAFKWTAFSSHCPKQLDVTHQTLAKHVSQPNIGPSSGTIWYDTWYDTGL